MRGRKWTWRPRSHRLSKQPLFCEAQCPGSGHDEVIENADINQCQGRLQGGGQCPIGSRCICRTTGVVVSQDDGGGISGQALDNDFSWVNRGLCQGAPEHFQDVENLVLGIQKDHHENLVGFVGEEELQVVANCDWAAEIAGLEDFSGE